MNTIEYDGLVLGHHLNAQEYDALVSKIKDLEAKIHNQAVEIAELNRQLDIWKNIGD